MRDCDMPKQRLELEQKKMRQDENEDEQFKNIASST